MTKIQKARKRAASVRSGRAASGDRGTVGGGAALKILSALLTTLVVVALFVAPAAAQGPEGEPIYKSREGPGFELYADGSIVTGDVLGGCEALVRDAYPKPVEPDPELLRQIEACEEFGFRVPGSESLPETGGPSLQIVAALGLILSCALCRVVTR